MTALTDTMGDFQNWVRKAIQVHLLLSQDTCLWSHEQPHKKSGPPEDAQLEAPCGETTERNS